jgi:hypothetical protein
MKETATAEPPIEATQAAAPAGAENSVAKVT